MSSAFSKVQIRQLSNALKYQHTFNPKITPPRQAWVENFVGMDRQFSEIIDLHPRVFGVFPRIDYVSNVIAWQLEYRKVNYVCMPTRNELPGGTQKPWPQKGTGRARHGSVNSPIFLKGGWARGPRGPTTNYTLKPHHYLYNSMRSILTIKLAQDDLKIVDSLEVHSIDSPEELEKAFEQRGWGPSVLLVDEDAFPDKLAELTSTIGHVNMMPYQGLNTLSMCKHETMVITLNALRKVEDKLLYQLMRVDLTNTMIRYKD